MVTEPVFVYGTLKRGESNHHLLRGSKFVQQDGIKAKLYNIGVFPGIIPGDDLVCGEMYMVSKNTLGRLDSLEGHPHHYERLSVTTVSGNAVWAYFYQRSITNREYLPDGTWSSMAKRQTRPT